MAAHADVFHTKGSGTYDTGDARAWFTFSCPHCGSAVNGAVLAFTRDSDANPVIRWVRCPGCGEGAVVSAAGVVSPPALAGPSIQGLPAEVREAYGEARRCYSVAAYTGCELMCRKLLMHVAVEKGAKEGDTFQHYVDTLEAEGFLGPHVKPWVDQIRSHGNQATHELPMPSAKRAESTLTFTAQLLRNVYEMPFLHARLADDDGDTA